MGSKFHYLVVNTLSGSRTFLAPVVFALFLSSNAQALRGAVILLLVLHLTDYFDGILARRWQVCTKFGFLMDALGDASLSILSYFVIFALLDADRIVVFLLVMREVLNFVFLSFVDGWYKLVDDARAWTRIPYLAVIGLTTLVAIYAALVRMSVFESGYIATNTINWALYICCAFYYVTLIVPAYIYWPENSDQ